jgi:AcrR family transcriptional regulator
MGAVYLALSANVNPAAQSRQIVLRLPWSMAATLKIRKQQLVRDTIWDAAMDLFAEKGFDETTVDDIAQAAGISRRSFFRYFSSKADLMAHGIGGYAALLAEAIDACPRALPLAEVVRQTVVQVARQSAAHPRTAKIMQIAATYPAARDAQWARMSELQDRVTRAFARRCGRTRRNDPAPALLGSMTISMLSVIFRLWFEHGRKDISPIADEVFATLGRLVCGPGKIG